MGIVGVDWNVENYLSLRSANKQFLRHPKVMEENAIIVRVDLLDGMEALCAV